MATITNASDKSNEFLTARVRSQVVDIDGTGGTGTIADGDVVKTGLFAPEGAIVTKITYFVITALTGSGSSGVLQSQLINMPYRWQRWPYLL